MKTLNDQELFEMDCFIIRAIKSAEMHNWFVCKRNYNLTEKEADERYKFINEQGQEYRSKIDNFNEDLNLMNIRRMKVHVYLAEHDENFENWSETRKLFGYTLWKQNLEKLNLYPVTEEEYQKIKFE